jgi:hypothetical protein
MTNMEALRRAIFGPSKPTYDPPVTSSTAKLGQQLEQMRSGAAYKDTPVETTDTLSEIRWEYETQVGRTVEWVATWTKYPDRNSSYDMYSTCYHRDPGVEVFLTREKAIKNAKEGSSSTGRIRAVRVETKMDFHEPYSVV